MSHATGKIACRSNILFTTQQPAPPRTWWLVVYHCRHVVEVATEIGNGVVFGYDHIILVRIEGKAHGESPLVSHLRHASSLATHYGLGE